MRKCQDHLAVGGAKAAGAVGQINAHQRADDAAEDPAAELADDGLLVISGLEKARADDQIDIAPVEALDEAADFRRPVLAVAIHLHCHVISVQGGIAISRLHRAADPKIERQADHRHARRHLADGVVG